MQEKDPFMETENSVLVVVISDVLETDTPKVAGSGLFFEKPIGLKVKTGCEGATAIQAG